MIVSSLLSVEAFWRTVTLLIPISLFYLLSVAVYNRYFHPLRRFPGPFWASITSLWYFQVIRLGKTHQVQHALHKKYGDFVRIGPRYLAVNNPAAIETVFGPKNGAVWRKGDFYDGFDAHIPNARTDSFSERDDSKHAERRRLVASLYTQGNVLKYEPCIDRLIALFRQRMESFCESGESTDMSVWMTRYAFDVVGEVFHGRQEGFGMVRDGEDYNKWCYLMEVMPNIGASVTYIPWGFRTMFFASQLVFQRARDGLQGMQDVIRQAEKSASLRWEAMHRDSSPPPDDILTGLLEVVREKGAKARWSVADVMTEVWAVIWAGSDTTANALNSIFYHLHKNPIQLAKLRQEIEAAFEEGRLSYPVRFGDARKLPYLHAVVMESMRVHPSLGLGLPREVPAGGADLCGTFVPGKVEVIMNSGAVQFYPQVFGDDAEEWIPERWLGDASRVRQMERSMLQFGHGPRMCIGKHISEIEMYKLLPTILREFDFELMVDEWKVWGGWFHRVSNVVCKVKRRNALFG